jgi:hypothetical protein
LEIQNQLPDEGAAAFEQFCDRRRRSVIEAAFSFNPEKPGQAPHGAGLAANEW